MKRENDPESRPEEPGRDTQEIDTWDAAGAAVVTGGDLGQESPKPDPVALALDPHSADDVTATDAEAKWNEDAEQAAEPKDRSRVLMLWGSRAMIGVLALGAATGIGFGAVWATGDTGPSIAAEVDTPRYVPQDGRQQVVCPPAHIRLGEMGAATAGAAGITQPAVDGADAASIPLTGVDGAELAVISAPASSDTVSGVQRVSVSDDDMSGRALAACTAPSWSQWLVGGSTQTGRQSSIVLANPGEQTARVSLEVFDIDGAVAGTGGSQIVIDAGSAQVLDLASLSVGSASPAVRISSEGSPVSAFLQQSTIRGLEPGGVDVLESTVAVSGEQHFAGVPIGDGHGHGSEGLADAEPALRIVADGAEAQVRLTFDDGSGDPIVTDVRVPATSVYELPLGELGEGVYSISLESQQSIAAGIRLTPLDTEDHSDFAWMSPARSLDAATVVGIPWLDREPRLHVLNSAATAQTFLIGDDEVELEPGARLTLPVDDEEIRLQGDGLRASVTYLDSGAAAFTVQPSPAATAAIAVEQ